MESKKVLIEEIESLIERLKRCDEPDAEPQCPDYGEPQRYDERTLRTYDRYETWIFESSKHRHSQRAVACVNALAGIADPAAFVERAKRLEKLYNRYNADGISEQL